MICARFDDYEADRKKKDEMINSLEEKVLGLTEKVDKLSSLVDRQEYYSGRIFFYCYFLIEIHSMQG